MIEIGTAFILEDEPCFCLTETDMTTPHGKRRRFRNFTVVRSDKLATYRQDIGASKSFKTDEIRVIGGVINEGTQKIEILHTVGELIDIVNDRRQHPSFDKHEITGLDKIKV